MTELNERLKANADRMREIADAQGTVAPGTQEKRVWVPSKDLENWAQTSEDAAKEMSEARQPTAFEREHPGYAKALREADKADYFDPADPLHSNHEMRARRVGKAVTLEHMRRVHEALKLNHMARFAGYAVDENGSLYRVGVVRRAGEAPSEIMFLTMTRDDLDDIADLIAGFDNEYPVRAFLQFVQERFNIKLDRPKLLTERD